MSSQKPISVPGTTATTDWPPSSTNGRSIEISRPAPFRCERLERERRGDAVCGARLDDDDGPERAHERVEEDPLDSEERPRRLSLRPPQERGVAAVQVREQALLGLQLGEVAAKLSDRSAGRRSEAERGDQPGAPVGDCADVPRSAARAVASSSSARSAAPWLAGFTRGRPSARGVTGRSRRTARCGQPRR